MLSKIKHWKHEAGLTIVEAIVATALLGIGFVGIYTMTGVSAQSLSQSVLRQKMQMQANQILNVIEADQDNMANYVTTLTTCTVPAVDETDAWVIRAYEWCSRIEGEAGAAEAGEERSISMSTLADGRRVIHVVLEANAANVQVVMKRIFDG